ncbi:MAG: molecular chaperone DnaJ [Kiritimatiellae bacterium]|nr:molecular chaperone DnaJ [Kiritimatiellia bacterium]
MADKRDYYEVLGVEKSATADQIKSAYRKLAMKYHPDRNPGDETAKAKFQEASEAYEVLSNPEKRQRYDQFGHQGVNFGPGGFDFGRDFSGFQDVDLSDLFGNLFGGGGAFGGFGDFFGGGRRRQVDPNAPERGRDMTMELEVDFDEAVFGSERTLELSLPEQCDECGGTGAAKGAKRAKCHTCGGRGQVVRGNGFFQVRQTCPTCGGVGTVIERPCSKCGGSGQMRVKREISLRIPKGVDTGSRLRLAGKGAGGLRGGEPGDLYVLLRVRESDVFMREGPDLAVDVPVSPVVAAVGGSMDVPTPEGMASLKLPAGTPNGKLFRLRGKGMPSLRGGVAGDLVARVVFEVPQRLTAKQRGLLDDLVKLLDDSNFPEKQAFGQRVKTFYAHKEKLGG